jgi:hypothetical protein
VLRLAGRTTPIEPIAMADWPRDSMPPSWAVLSPTPLPAAASLRHWRAALAAHLSSLTAGRMAER